MTWRPIPLAIALCATVGHAQIDVSARARLAGALGDTARVTAFLERWSFLSADSSSIAFLERRPPVAGPSGHRIVREISIERSGSMIIRFEVSCDSGHLRSRRVTFYSDRAATRVASVDSVPEDWSTGRPSPGSPWGRIVAKACG
jgi:hypothetical protein